jgi:hypothetical protein
MNKTITIILVTLFVSSCGFFDYDDQIVDIHDKQRDGWDWIEWKGNEIIIDHYDTAKGEWGKYCAVTGSQTCMFQESKNMFYIEINIEKHDYDKALNHFKKHILLWESLKPAILHHDIMSDCQFQCDKAHVFRSTLR